MAVSGSAEVKRCPVCDREVADISAVVGGRPRVYCGDICKRAVEKKVRRHHVTLRWARRMVNLSPISEGALRHTLGEKRFLERVQAARDILQAAGELDSRTQ